MFCSRAYPPRAHHWSYYDYLMLIWYCACERIILVSLRRHVRLRFRGCGPGPSPSLGGPGLELSQFAGPASPQPWLAYQVKHPCSKDRKLPASPAEEVWHGQSTARFVFPLSYFTGARRSPDIVPIPRKVVRVQSPMSRIPLPTYAKVYKFSCSSPSSQNVTKLWMPG